MGTSAPTRNWSNFISKLGGPRCAAPTPSDSKRLLGKARHRTEIAPALIFLLVSPQWGGRNLDGHSDFARRKFSSILQVRVPRNGGLGVSGPMGTKCPSAASPGDPLVSFPSLGKKLAPQGETLPPPAGGEIPLRGTKPLYHRPLIRPSVRTGAPSPQGEGLLRYPFEK